MMNMTGSKYDYDERHFRFRRASSDKTPLNSTIRPHRPYMNDIGLVVAALFVVFALIRIFGHG
jgi:hypothetical protein